MISKEKILRLVLDVLVIEIGLMISSLGTAFFYAADLGSSAMATCCDGLHLLLNISYGDANTLANATLLILLFLLCRSYINVGTVLCVFTIGPWVNLFTPLLQGLKLSEMNMAVRILCTLVGTAMMGVGLGLYIAVDRGFGALEGLVKYARTRFGISVRVAKIVQDAVLVGTGILLGAQWGIGTVVGILLTGPVLQKSSQFFGRQLTHLRGAAKSGT